MPDKKETGRGVVDSIAALRLKRYMEKGPGASSPRAPKKPTIDKLRAEVSKVVVKKSKKKSRGKRRG